MVWSATMEPKKCDVLVVDTAGFIKSARLEQIGDQVHIDVCRIVLDYVNSSYIHQIVNSQAPNITLHIRSPDCDSQRSGVRDPGPRHQATVTGSASVDAPRHSIQRAKRGGFESW